MRHWTLSFFHCIQYNFLFENLFGSKFSTSLKGTRVFSPVAHNFTKANASFCAELILLNFDFNPRLKPLNDCKHSPKLIFG